ncbi:MULTISPECIES: cell wall assembly protein [Myroides]|nr:MULTISPECIES: cell wall assembly protein [Myroides]MCO7723160.1 cell wall assembly protein [Myroides odoratimimus]MCS7475201.1 cell wall assembly protein [Myroides odoratimimus]MDO5858896.1 cell wall assembly protein [Myroides odoratimimus]MDX4975314.1 cell wall assembly protein [Myroides odoratimimus]MEC4036502.1 cell wall assembly protein [Myroides odoratimimus]
MNITMVKEEFTALFKGYKVPNEIKSLLEFQTSENIPSYYSNAIYLIDEDPGIIESISEEEEFVNSFVPFAEANSTGSIFAFWVQDKAVKSLDNCPIVVFGDEGGVFIVAKNIKELLQISAYDVEAVVFMEEFYFPDKEELIEEGEFDAAEFNKEFLDWLRTDAKLKPILTIEAIDEVIANAQDQFADELEQFIAKFA